MPEKATLKQVAARAGVSYQTVSKVLNKQAQVSSETEARIWEAVRTLGYRPNLIARSMRTQQSRMIGYSWVPASPDQGNPILDQFLQSMAQAAEGAGYHLLTFPHHPGEQWLNAYRDLIDTARVDGFIISSIDYNDARIAFLQERQFPFVAFGRSNPGWDFPYVDIDGAAGMRQVVAHLTGLGHRRIFALAWPEDSRVGQNRMDGFLAGLLEAGMTPPQNGIVRGPGEGAFGFDTTREWLALPAAQRPTAIVAFNDFMAIGAMRAIAQAGLQVGVDVAVTGFDDIPMTQYLTPSLTSVRQPIWEVGQQVVSILLSCLNEENCQHQHLLLTPQLVIRQSSDPAAA